MRKELERLYEILATFLGEAKKGFDDGVVQYQFPCPNCIDREGHREASKYNLEVNLQKGVFNCWKCSSIDERMSGSVTRLIRRYGNEKLLSEYKSVLMSIRNSELYKINFTDDDFKVDTSIIDKEELKLPPSFKRLKEGEKCNSGALRYLSDRGIGWDVIERYKIGYTEGEKDDEYRRYSYRIVIPSYNGVGELNYWVGRDYLPDNGKKPKTRNKYANPTVEKTEIIFNEDKLQWDADINLVEGPFDHIVVPNSVPLLGKALNKSHRLYWEILSKANANVNIFLDGDAKETVREIYKLLNHGRLYNKVRYIPIGDDDDPSTLYEKGGYKKIAEHLANAQQISEMYLS